VRKDTVLSPHDLAFLLIKSKKHYKIKLSINLILKKNKKINFERKRNPSGKTLQQLTMFCEESYRVVPDKIK
jgi:hypothetical protein